MPDDRSPTDLEKHIKWTAEVFQDTIPTLAGRISELEESDGLEKHRLWTGQAIKEILNMLVNIEQRLAIVEEASAKPKIEVVQ